MFESDHCEEHSPEATLFMQGLKEYSHVNGYFGKPTKLRTSEPSMFEILTWNEQSTKDNWEGKNEGKNCCNCSCKCNQAGPSVEKETKSSPTPQNNGQPSMKKLKEDESRKVDQQLKSNKDTKQIQNREHRSPDQQKSQVQVRPKSAGAKQQPKSVKIMTSPAKLPKFIGEALKHQAERVEEPIEVKEKLIEKVTFIINLSSNRLQDGFPIAHSQLILASLLSKTMVEVTQAQHLEV